jgi:hypothetical protein
MSVSSAEGLLSLNLDVHPLTFGLLEEFLREKKEFVLLTKKTQGTVFNGPFYCIWGSFNGKNLIKVMNVYDMTPYLTVNSDTENLPGYYAAIVDHTEICARLSVFGE